MNQLTVLDAMFLHLETAETPMGHTLPTPLLPEMATLIDGHARASVQVASTPV